MPDVNIAVYIELWVKLSFPLVCVRVHMQELSVFVLF